MVDKTSIEEDIQPALDIKMLANNLNMKRYIIHYNNQLLNNAKANVLKFK